MLTLLGTTIPAVRTVISTSDQLLRILTRTSARPVLPASCDARILSTAGFLSVASPQRPNTAWVPILNRSPVGRCTAAEDNVAGTPSVVASIVVEHPLASRTRARHHA